ncbi:MAG: SDR family oxidoreductase [Deltaproteobacteria bacterium]|nr:SDR family oxidoreductase [Deltaproteobacteria bacterium]
MPDYGIKDKVAVVTGAAGNGLGRADVIALSACGCKTAVLDIAPCDETIKIIADKGGIAKGYTCDISKTDQVTETVKKINQELGPVGILINNASILTTVGMFGDIPVDRWNRDIEVNTIGTANITRAVWPQMIQQKWGRIIMMSSIAGTSGGLGQTSYSTTKASVIGLGKSLALEGAHAGITVNIIAPGVIETGIVGFIREDMRDRMKKATPLRRFGRPEEIADTIAFLCSQQARYITGQVIGVDGGMGLFVF